MIHSQTQNEEELYNTFTFYPLVHLAVDCSVDLQSLVEMIVWGC